ncbi:MAG: 3-dehydroquinate synthase [Massiliimalia sp.]|jgi:3-dehydroquinate synthase
MKKISISTSHPYQVTIGQDLLSHTGSLIEGVCSYERVAIITDDMVAPLYLQTVMDSFDEKISVYTYTIPHGEASKCAQSLLSIYDFLAERHFTRSDLIVALGGGVVGDLAGFCAATFLRGIPYVQIPTTLLAQVDSSVGGKTAIDLPAGKNLVGSFYQPAAVLCDTNTLSTLSSRDFSSGAAEVIKYACIWDKELFPLLYHLKQPEILEQVIARCIEIKAQVVAQDEFDTGLRMILNFGHTIGHAVEKQFGFSTYTHGEGVSIGMVQMTQLSEQAGFTKPGTAAEIADLCEHFHLPISCDITKDQLMEHCAVDKKNLNHKIHLILLKEIGSCFVHKLSQEEFHTFLTPFSGKE